MEEVLELDTTWAEECEMDQNVEIIQFEDSKVDNQEVIQSQNDQNFNLQTNKKRKYKDINRLKNIRNLMPFTLASHYFIDDNKIIFVSAGIRTDLASNEFRGNPFEINLNNRTSNFVYTRDIKKSILDKLEQRTISFGMKKALKHDLNLNAKYEKNFYYIDPSRVVSFMFEKCNEARHKRPLIVTWQSSQNITFLCKHIIWEKNIVKCFLCGKICNNYNSLSPDDGAYFIMDNNGNPQIICNSELHNREVAGLVNPVWINMIAIKYPGQEDFQLEFKYENKVTIFKVLLSSYNSTIEKNTKYLSIEDTHKSIGCPQQHGNPKTISGILSYSQCIFSTFHNDICKLVEKKYNK